MTRWRTRHRGVHAERGAAAVEFAIVFVLLIFILFSIIDFGRLFFAVQGVKSASREGARVAAVQGDATAITNAVAGASDAAETLATDGNGAAVAVSTCRLISGTTFCSNEDPLPTGAAGFSSTPVVSANTDPPLTIGPPGDGTTIPCAAAEAVEVTVTADFRWFTPTMPLLGTVVGPASVPTVSSSTAMRCEPAS